MFEALRGLRDSVAPESTNNPKGDENDDPNNTESESTSTTQRSPIDLDMDYDDFLLAYYRDDPIALEFIKMADNKPPKTREEYTNLRAKFTIIRASELTSRLAGNIFSKSAEVNSLVEKLPNRTKEEQLERIAELIEQNKVAEEGLRDAFAKAQVRQTKLRSVLDKVTCESLGIFEER